MLLCQVKLTLKDAAEIHDRIEVLRYECFHNFIAFVLTEAGFELALGGETRPIEVKDIEGWANLLKQRLESINLMDFHDQTAQVSVWRRQEVRLGVLALFRLTDELVNKGAAFLNLAKLMSMSEVASRIVIVCPVLWQLYPEHFREAKNFWSGQVDILPTDEFLFRFIPEDKKDRVLNSWVKIRDESINYLLERHPSLIEIVNFSKLVQIDMRLKEAESYLRSEKLREAVALAGPATEELLRIVYFILFKKHPEGENKDNIKYLLDKTKEFLEEKIGRIVPQDIDYIRQVRNRVSHTLEEIDGIEAFQTVYRTRCFLEALIRFMTKKGLAQ